MSDKTQLIAQIRFALEQLSERNAQHEWEHLCRHFARERLCSNLLPATGPVQAGGDQGRDFETFRTYLEHSHLKGRSFIGLVSDKSLAFACSLEQKVRAKIQNDVTTIMASGAAVEGIYFFSSRGLAVAERHKLQDWARTTHNIHLDIFDGAAMAELLAEHDLAWLAARFLQLPAELFSSLVPDGTAERDWYTRTLDKWREQETPARTYADFSEIRSAAYVARGPRFFDEQGQPVDLFERPELPFWIERLDEIAGETGNFESLRRHAFFESCVLRLRGMGSLIGQEARIQRFFADLPLLEDVSLISEAEALLVYLAGAISGGVASVTWTEVDRWFEVLVSLLDERLRDAKKAQRVNERCALLEIRGHMALLRPVRDGQLDVPSIMQHWKELARSIKAAPLFPLEHFSHNLNEMADILGDHPDYETLTQAVDALLSDRFGQFKTADSCLARAKSFMAAGDLPRAMAQLHRAKVDWFAVETLDKSLLAQEVLSQAYAEQHLFFAAKYYALASAYSALYADGLKLKPRIAGDLERAASYDYAMGAWFGFLSLGKAVAAFYPHYSNSIAEDFNSEGSALQGLMFHLVMLTSATNVLQEEIAGAVHERCAAIAQRLGLGDGFDELSADNDRNVVERGADTLWNQIEEQLHGAPWSDSGPIRFAQWKAHGITWEADWKNDFPTTVAAEGFLSALQVILSDLSGNDLYLMRTSIRLSIQMKQVANWTPRTSGEGWKEFDVSFGSGNSARAATIIIPPYQWFQDGSLSQDDLLIGTLAVVSALLAEVSLLPSEQYRKLLDARYRQGLITKLLVGAPYGTCMLAFVSQGEFVAAERSVPAPAREFVSRQEAALPWSDALVPTYNTGDTHKALENRYQNFALSVCRTLRRLCAVPEFMDIVSKLRSEGWKDWHILSAVHHVAMHHQLNALKASGRSINALREATQKWASDPQPEPHDAPVVPVEEFAEDKLRFALKIYMLAFATTSGLENHQRTPDFVGLEYFLARRYRFWMDDIEHEDPFLHVAGG